MFSWLSAKILVLDCATNVIMIGHTINYLMLHALSIVRQARGNKHFHQTLDNAVGMIRTNSYRDCEHDAFESKVCLVTSHTKHKTLLIVVIVCTFACASLLSALRSMCSSSVAMFIHECQT